MNRKGLRFIFNLPEEIKQKIESEYGNIESLYGKISELVLNDFKLNFTNANPKLINQNQKELYEIEDKLEEFGVEDSTEITSEIRSDYDEIFALKEIAKLELKLNELGISIKD